MNRVDEQVDRIKKTLEKIQTELSRVVVGQEELIRQIFICLLCGGHALIEGVPGLGKTLLVKSLGRILHLKYSRIQFTPDLMPADILGTNIVNQDDSGNRFFEFYRGPIFGQLILADEINRATPKTQSALLEAMQEQAVTVFGKKYILEPPFMVLATQNPLEMEGTYPLPEAQIDRFFFKLKIDYPTPQQLLRIIDKTTENEPDPLIQVVGAEAILEMRSLVREVPVADHIKDYAVKMIMATHPGDKNGASRVKQYVRYGSSPRGVQTLILAAKVLALLKDRFNVSREDIREVAKPALRHRLILNLRGEAEGLDPDAIIDEIIQSLS
ncbi:MAG: MoxR family ATPase [Thermodesulfobacteriota bacterium]